MSRRDRVTSEQRNQTALETICIFQWIPRLTLFGAVLILISGCGVTLSPVKRKPLQVSALRTPLSPSSRKLWIRFESTLPGQPLAETVWDNVTGAFADAKESKQIGYTQDYATLIPATAVGTVVGGVEGGVSTGVAVGTQPEYTRIVIPFGRVFEEVFQSGLRQAFPNSLICSNNPGNPEQLPSPAPAPLVSLKIVDFQIWEKPLNHLNLKATVECKTNRTSSSDSPEAVFIARHEMLNQPVGTVMTTSAGFIREMNKISSRFAGVLSEEILENLQKTLGQ